MACTIAFPFAAIAPSVSDSWSPKLRNSLCKSSNESLFHKRAITSTWLANSFNLKTKINIGQPTRVLVNRQIVCRAAGQARMVPDYLLELENATRPPTNLYTAKAPHTATILSVNRIPDPNAPEVHDNIECDHAEVPEAPEEYYNIEFDHAGFLPHWEGQVFGVILPKENPFEPVAKAKPSYFSAASSRYGDHFNGRTATLCVRPVGSHDDISRRLVNSRPGDKFQFTGPRREGMLLGDYNPNAKHIFVATGTGIAPFRAHLCRFFKEYNPKFTFSGFAWLLQEKSNGYRLPYEEEFMKYKNDYPLNFRYTRTETFADHAARILYLLLNGAYIYFAGREGMVDPIEIALSTAARERGLDWATILESLKRNNQWRVEVY